MGSGKPEDEDFNKWPPWLKPLLREKFFIQCKNHPNSHKNECNMYCLDCMNGPICPLCLPHHINHRAIQIRRSSYNDVVRASDIQKMIDISGIQTYIINSARVVFLNERPQSRPGKGVTNTCLVCERSLLDIFRFCSLGCKIVGTSKNFQKKKKIQAPVESDSENSCSTSSTTTREEMMNNYYNNNNNNNSVIQSFAQMPPQTSLNFRKRRRKGIPHRAPLF
ncbi:hypothetical protein RND81_13G013400 [Saponaria officinalis]|uniref:PLATZ transcription factor family protein n=1 Tax=Saponaria officinalis TaxID=3572 RepID=A0AAW1GZB5_SAPOF